MRGMSQLKNMTDKQEVALYQGTVKITFWPDSHRYKLAGAKDYLISATAATGVVDKSRFLIPWAVNLTANYLRKWLETNPSPYLPGQLLPVIDEATKQHTLKKEEAASIGDLVHAYAESTAMACIHGGEIPPIPEDAEPELVAGINAFLDWYIKNDVKFIHAEKIVYSREHGYVGIVDAIAKVNGQTVLIDYKTSKAVYNEHRYQVAGYRQAYEEEYGKLDGAFILHFDKETGECGVHALTDDDHKKDLPAFLACLTLKKREKELNK